MVCPCCTSAEAAAGVADQYCIPALLLALQTRAVKRNLGSSAAARPLPRAITRDHNPSSALLLLSIIQRGFSRVSPASQGTGSEQQASVGKP